MTKEAIMKLQTYKLFEDGEVLVCRDDVLKALEQEPCEDTISRQAAIDALKEHRALYCDNTPDTFSKLSYAEKSRVDELDTAIATLVNLPSAQPERIKGHWIDAVIPNDSGCLPVIVCDKCNTFFPLQFGASHNFCPNCGAKMEETT